MKIILSGGGTLGPVAPLLAIYEIYKSHNSKCGFVWVGTKKGPERQVVEKYDLPFITITSGKLRRYFSWRNFLDIFRVLIGFFQSLWLLLRFRPQVVISAGGFVSVPLHWAASFLGIPSWIHQQDMRVGLANKLMAPVARKITVALESGLQHYPAKKTEWIGNPVRDLQVDSLSKARAQFDIPPKVPVIFAFGGGTGSAKLNNLVVEALPHWPRDWHVIHLTGQERSSKQASGAKELFANYHPYRFFTEEMASAYAIADVVIGRGGFVTITELASLAKAAILLPMPETHQEENVKMLAEHKAAIILDERKVSGVNLARTVKELVDSPKTCQYLGKNLQNTLPPAQPEKIIEIIDILSKD